MVPGEIALTRMPCGANSLACDFVSAISPALAAAYAPAPGPPPECAAIDTTLMMAPDLRSIIDGATVRVQAIALVRFRLITSFHSSSLISAFTLRATREPAL